ncbi:polysaccharide deacetylase family protein [Bacillus tianshenii]|nr:polysaccharide deacetylase family protein [Bacillus tianshenii]
MKKIGFVLFCAFLLSACGTNTASEPADENQSAQAEKKEEEKSADAKNEEKVEQEQPKEEEGQQEEEVQAEEQEPQYRINSANWGVEPIEEASENVVLLTFDDAPDKHALEIANTLKEKDAPAIFFVNGHFIDTEEEKKVLKQIYDMGFTIGNHTYNHKQLDTLSQQQQKEEIVSLSDEIEAVIGERPKYFRAPFGVNTDYSKQVVAEEGMLLMNWSYGYDWNKEYMSKDAIADIMVNTPLLRNGSNLLMHDREWTAAGLPQIIDGLREKGYTMVDPELLETPEDKQQQ